ncbi:cupin domain-containing protein [Saccharopolyspora shandongensis]|uniref:cupin domain-containing protein n=1 Tax=Saccharopolyspora shandongensis TaxID=418495 RepID=UPI00340F894A
MSHDRFIFLSPGESRPTRVPLPPWTTVKAGVADTGGRLSLLENNGDGSIPAHVHDTFDEFVYVLGGELGIEVGGRTHRLSAGMCALLPRGVTHAMRNLSEEPVHALQLSAPGGWEHYIEDVSDAGQTLMREDGSRGRAKINEIGAPYGMRYHLGDAAGDGGDAGRFFVLEAGQARPGRLRVPPAFAVKARSGDTGGAFSLLEVVVAQEIPRHVHHEADECIYVLDGALTVEFDGRIHTATRGQFVLLPHGVPHALRPGSTPPPRVLQISSPGGWECFVEDLIEARAQVSSGGRLDPAALNAIAAKYRITYEE